MTIDFTIRSYRPSDLETLRAITMEAFDGVSIDRNIEERFGLIGDRDWSWRKARHIDMDADRDPEGIFVAESGGKIVGYITTWVDQEGSTGLIPNLAVTADARGKGIGRALIQHAVDYFRSLDLEFARIETLVQNEVGKQLYPTFGFEEVARQIHYGMRLK